MAGDPVGAQNTLGSALPRLSGTSAQSQAQRLEGAIRFAQSNAAEAARILASASQALARDDRMARETMLMALQAAIWAGPAQTREIAGAARTFPPVPFASASVADLLLEGYSARFTLGYQASVEPFRSAVTALLAEDLDPAVGLRWFALGTAAAGSLWDDQAAFDLSLGENGACRGGVHHPAGRAGFPRGLGMHGRPLPRGRHEVGRPRESRAVRQTPACTSSRWPTCSTETTRRRCPARRP